ncbi:MAG: PRC-barrel domain-containing protein [Planctomycetota bacterium]
MNIPLRIALLGTLSLLTGMLFAEEPATSLEAARPLVNRVVAAGTLVGTDLGSKRYQLGNVSDLVIDLQRGRVALLIFVNNDLPVDKPERTALPMSAVSFDGKAWQLKSRVNDQQIAAAKRFAYESTGLAFHRESVRQLRLAFGIDSDGGEPEAELDSRDKLALWSDVRESKLLDVNGAVAGNIEDLGIAPESGEILYAAIDMGQAGVERKFLYPVPLSAFVVTDASKPWRIELPQLELRDMDSFARDQWPTEVSRGWVEYVHVRYGNSERSGVQSKLKATSQRNE